MEKFQNYWKIDSCSMTFRVEDLDNYDKSLHDEWILINSNTGEKLEGFVRKDYKSIDIQGVRYDVKYFAIQNPKTLITTRYINLIIYSRHLLEDYFKGITDDTLVSLYANIMDTGLIECSFDVFINAKVSQPDFAIDSFATVNQVDHISAQLNKLKCSNSDFKQFKIGGQIHSYQFGIRKLGRKIMYSYSKPFFKLYSKYEDAYSSERKHVIEFYSKIGFDPESLKDYYRFEMSIKDTRHMNQYIKKYWREDYKLTMTLKGLCYMIKDEQFMRDVRIDMLQKKMKKAVEINHEEVVRSGVLDKLLENIVQEVVSNSSMNITETVIYIMNTFFKGVGNSQTQRNYKRKITSLVKTEIVKQMRDLNKDGLAGVLVERGAVELKGEPYDFNRVLANLVL